MKTILILSSGIIIGFVIAWAWSGRKKGTQLSRELSEKKKENLAKIMEYLNERDRITNDDVEKFLGVSHATSFRYLEELENEGKLKQVGNTGSGVYYEKL